MNTCATCQFWTRQPDLVYQRTEWQKPDGDPIVIVSGVCQCEKLSHGGLPLEDGLAAETGYDMEENPTITTGPKFGCIHHKPKEP